MVPSTTRVPAGVAPVARPCRPRGRAPSPRVACGAGDNSPRRRTGRRSRWPRPRRRRATIRGGERVVVEHEARTRWPRRRPGPDHERIVGGGHAAGPAGVDQPAVVRVTAAAVGPLPRCPQVVIARRPDHPGERAVTTSSTQLQLAACRRCRRRRSASPPDGPAAPRRRGGWLRSRRADRRSPRPSRHERVSAQRVRTAPADRRRGVRRPGPPGDPAWVTPARTASARLVVEPRCEGTVGGTAGCRANANSSSGAAPGRGLGP